MRGGRGLKGWLGCLAAAATLALAGCGGTGSSGSTPVPPARSSSAPESTLVFQGGGGAVGATLKKLLTAWGARHGIAVTYVVGTSESGFAQIQAQQKAGHVQIDVQNNNDQIVALGRAQGVWQKLDMNLMTNAKDVATDYAFPKDVVGSPAYGVRYLVIPEGIAYNTQVFAKNGWSPPTSWQDVYGAKYAKCAIPLSPQSGVNYIPWLNYLNSKDYGNTGTTFANFRKIAHQVPSFSDSNPAALNIVAQGIGCVTPSQQGRTLEQAAAGSPLGFVFPKEGSPFLGGTLSIPRGAPHPIAAQMAINYLLSAEAGQGLLEDADFASVNLQVKKSIREPAAQLTVASGFKTQKLHDIPVSTYDKLDDWIREWNDIASSH